MGCNYYLYKKDSTPWILPINRLGQYIERDIYKMGTGELSKDACILDFDKCTVEQDGLHIGKASFGWHFNLCIYPFMRIYNLEDWKKLFNDDQYYIMDEYEEPVTPADMLRVIMDRTSYGLKEALEAGKTIEEYEQEQVDRNNSIDKQCSGGKNQAKDYDDLLRKNRAERGINGLWAHSNSIWDERGKEEWKRFMPMLVPHYRTDGPYDLTPDWDFS